MFVQSRNYRFSSLARAHAPHPLTHARLPGGFESRAGKMRVLAFPSRVRGYCVYEERWTPVTNEELTVDRVRALATFKSATPTNQFFTYIKIIRVEKNIRYEPKRERKEGNLETNEKNPLYGTIQ